jgi:predicted dehydrogenase
VRKLRFFQPRQYVSLDFARQDLLVIDVGEESMGTSELPTIHDGKAVMNLSPGDAGAHPSGGMSLRKVAVVPGEPLRLEIESFLDAVRSRSQPLVTLEDGRAALALALEINASIAEHARRTGL